MSKRPRFDDEEDGEEHANKRIDLETTDDKNTIQNVRFNNDYEKRDVEQHEEDDNEEEEEEPQASSSEPPFLGVTSDLLQNIDPNMSMREILNHRKRTRPVNAGFIDYTQTRYYDRYKQQEYTRRNDYMKYCHVCRKKTVGKLRVLPGDLRMRKVWILRSNLDEDRSAELWLRELACEGSHGGEFCEIHFPPGSTHLKGNQLFPIDIRPPEGRHSVMEDILFEFDSIVLQCVFCGKEGNLNSMLPFIRNRAKRARWIDTLADGDVNFKRRLQGALKGGVTQFLCDWHIADSSFEINGFGEWRMLRNALPDPHLTATDKRGNRIYLVDKCRDNMFWDRHLWRGVDRLSRIAQGIEEQDDVDIGEADEHILSITNSTELEQFLNANLLHQGEIDQKQMILSKPILHGASKLENELENIRNQRVKEIIVKDEPSTSTDDKQHYEIEYSDDSDEENEMILKTGEIPYTERLCQVCGKIEPIGNDFPIKSHLRTWPFDEYRHKKWLEIMDWPQEFEDSMKTLWRKRRTEGTLSGDYHFCPINVCQAHLDYRKLPDKMDYWLRTFCVLCDSCMSSENLVVALPPDLETRQKWIDSLFPTNTSAKFQVKKIAWLRDRLLRPKATRYRICVYHFSRESFEQTSETNEIVINADSLPLSMESDDFDVIPRGPNSVCKCVLCEDWKKQTEMVILRNPSMESEKVFLADILLHADKAVVRKTIHTLSRSGKSALICSSHFPDQQDPFSIIAERRLLYNVQAECVLCSHTDECTLMIPFPSEEEEKLRTKWINSMCREPWVYRYLTKRLAKDGRHYLCSSHFSKNSLRYQTGLGLYRKPGCSPLLSCTNEEERQAVWDLSKSEHEYHPLAMESIDSNGIGPVDYDQVVDMLGFPRMIQIETEMHNSRSNDNSLPTRKKAHGLLDDELGERVDEEEIEEEIEHEHVIDYSEDVEEDGVIYDDMHQLEEEVAEGELLVEEVHQIDEDEMNVTISPIPPIVAEVVVGEDEEEHS